MSLRPAITARRHAAEMSLLGLPINRAGIDDVHAFIEETVAARKKGVALNLNVHCVNLAMQNPWLHEMIRDANLVFCDGDGVRIGLRLLGNRPPPKVTYNKWLWRLSSFCEQQGYRFFLLGGRPGVAEAAAANLRERHPRLQIVGTHHGYFDKAGDENRRVVEMINASSADVLLVCLGMPLQERWILDNLASVDVHVFLKGGAALDYAAGLLKKAPEWMIRCHLEWLFRLAQEPRRLFRRYVVGNPHFLLRVCFERLGWGRPRSWARE